MKSLRWQMQLWHAVVLTTVLMAFGSAVSVLQWQTRLQQIDAELGRTTDVVKSQLGGLIPPPAFRRGPPRLFQAPPHGSEEGAGRVGPPGEPRPFRGPPSEGFSSAEGDSAKPEERPRPPFESGRGPVPEQGQPPMPGPHGPPPEPRPFRLTPEFVRMFEGNDESQLDFTIWRSEGQRLHKSPSAPEVPFPGVVSKPGDLPLSVTRTRDGRREMVATIFDLNIVVGRSIRKDIAQQQQANLLLVLMGSGVLGFGLLGGWFLSSRAIRPITSMSATARTISARNLSQRIDLAGTASELSELGAVLNGAFDRLEEAFEQQTQFTADASHELRTPVAVIMANLELALSKPRSEEDYRKTLATCLRASQRMKSLIDSLLTLAQFAAADPALRKEELDLEKLATDVADMIRPLAQQRQLSVVCDTRPMTVCGDRERLSQVLTNLVSNAIRYNRDGGTITVSLREDAGQAVLTVADTGIGIPAEDQPRVFDRFYRVDKARSRAEGGSGLGLAICKTLVEAHGGSIQVRSTPDVGSTFEIRLPAVTPAESASPCATVS